MNATARWASWTVEELREALTEAEQDLADLTAEGKRRWPKGFTGNGLPGEFESWEEEWAEVDRDVRDYRAALAGRTWGDPSDAVLARVGGAA